MDGFALLGYSAFVAALTFGVTVLIYQNECKQACVLPIEIDESWTNLKRVTLLSRSLVTSDRDRGCRWATHRPGCADTEVTPLGTLRTGLRVGPRARRLRCAWAGSFELLPSRLRPRCSAEVCTGTSPKRRLGKHRIFPFSGDGSPSTSETDSQCARRERLTPPDTCGMSYGGWADRIVQLLGTHMR